MSEALFDAAAASGSLELLRWLWEHGCSWGGEATFDAAAGAGNEEALEWLATQGCPSRADGEPYIRAAANGDTTTLRCLARLGCPVGPPGRVFRAVLHSARSAIALWPMVHLLLQAGCTVAPEDMQPAAAPAGSSRRRPGWREEFFRRVARAAEERRVHLLRSEPFQQQ
ncbi:hypothetical protein GPECTOR_589g655 [Gonium pectorale]|uniref:Ankyrin repeat domain-containing protein n=1 Tax=Gonium pectorale TaxID=33097 RepID=A0A150FUL2_GONPE|nr:hypothetical protein GPECTOR_589g655 [Gonium pectorale]|eukprot:KXZ41268.1 hypothetical protein GPECTOR_589g655 [Gonium pectorale]